MVLRRHVVRHLPISHTYSTYEYVSGSQRPSNLHHALRGLLEETRGSVSYRESNHACMEQQVGAKVTQMLDLQSPP